MLRSVVPGGIDVVRSGCLRCRGGPAEQLRERLIRRQLACRPAGTGRRIQFCPHEVHRSSPVTVFGVDGVVLVVEPGQARSVIAWLVISWGCESVGSPHEARTRHRHGRCQRREP